MAVDDASRYNVLTDGSLMIEDIKRDDQGVFECMARNIVGDTMSTPAELRTQDAAAAHDVQVTRAVPSPDTRDQQQQQHSACNIFIHAAARKDPRGEIFIVNLCMVNESYA